MVGNGTLPLSEPALADNRAGRLTDAQRNGLRQFDRGDRGNKVWVAIACAIIAVLLFRETSPAPHAWARPFLALAALAVAGGLVLRSLGIGGRLARDITEGRVEALEGAIIKGHYSSSGHSTRNCYLDIAGQRFSVGRSSYQAAPDAGIVRIYYLPHSRHVVNLEQLADRPLPAGALESPLDALKALAPGLKSRDRGARAEAAATLAAMQHAMQPERGRTAVPPSAAERDPRPLAEAILGHWRSGSISLDFRADGTLQAILPSRQEHRGRWRLDPAGRLHADVTGAEQAGDAWIVGDTLTIVADGDPVIFRRA
jgi:hypothetical protein